MFNNKSLLYGLGLGLIIGASLLQLMHAATAPVSSPPDAWQAEQPLDEEGKQRLKEAASVYFHVYEKDERIYTEAQAEQLIRQRLSEAPDKEKPDDASGNP